MVVFVKTAIFFFLCEMPGIPKPTKVVKGNVTTITEYKEENGKLFKLTKTIEKKAVKTTRVIQERRVIYS